MDPDASRRLDELAAACSDAAGPIACVTGAGVSVASGIATFRGSDPEAVWKVQDVELATVDYFRRDPVGQWSWYLERFARVDSARPNAAHRAIARLEGHFRRHRGDFRLVTQNIDTLHESAGSADPIKIHGSADRVRCATAGCDHGAPAGSLERASVDLGAFRRDATLENLPRCQACGDVLRAHVLFFDEYYQEHDDYRFGEAMDLAARASAFLFVGTSFSVGITDIFLRAAAERRAPAFSIDPGLVPPAGTRVRHVAEPAETALPELARRLGAAGDDDAG